MMTVLDGEIFAILDDSQGGGVLCHISENLIEEAFDHSSGNLQSGTDGEIWVDLICCILLQIQQHMAPSYLVGHTVSLLKNGY